MSKIIAPTKDTLPIWANAMFLIGLVLFNLVDGLAIVFGYFLETVVIGVFHAIKLGLAVKHGKPNPPKHNMIKGMGIVLFFLVHYGFFVGIQTMILFYIISIDLPGINAGFDIAHNLAYVFQLKGMAFVIVSIVITNCLYFYFNFIKTRRFAYVAPSELFFKPYLRIFIQQFTVILSGFLVIVLSGAKAAAILLILFRWLTDSVMFAIKRDSKTLDYLAEKFTKEGDSIAKTKEQLQQLSE
jgi:Family of unknown function (DUF6498)